MYFQTMAVIGVSDIQVRGVGDVFNNGPSFSPEWKTQSTIRLTHMPKHSSEAPG